MGGLPVGSAILAATATLLTGCSAAEDAVTARSDHFRQALAADDTASACADLGSKTRSALERQEGMPCEQALAEQNLPHGPSDPVAEVYGSMAQVRYGEEAVFLSRFEDGWRVVAAGCPPTAARDQPHECILEAG